MLVSRPPHPLPRSCRLGVTLKPKSSSFTNSLCHRCLPLSSITVAPLLTLASHLTFLPMLSTFSSPLRIHTLLPPSLCSSTVLVTLHCLVKLLHLPLTAFRRSLPTSMSFVSSSHPPYFSCPNRPVTTCHARRRCYPTFLHFFSPLLLHSSSVVPLVAKSSYPMRVAAIAQLRLCARRLSPLPFHEARRPRRSTTFVLPPLQPRPSAVAVSLRLPLLLRLRGYSVASLYKLVRIGSLVSRFHRCMTPMAASPVRLRLRARPTTGSGPTGLGWLNLECVFPARRTLCMNTRDSTDETAVLR